MMENEGRIGLSEKLDYDGVVVTDALVKHSGSYGAGRALRDLPN